MPHTPFQVMVKPIGAQCNLRCDYCFYLEKKQLYPDTRGGHYRMRDDTLERFVRTLIESRLPGQQEVLFAWQGGEPTLMGLPFFTRVVALQRRYAPRGVAVRNAFQTNGVLVDDDFARFFHDHQFLVGVSVDGPQAVHDRFRRDRAGRGSFTAVMAGIERLNRHRVDYNLLTVVNSDNSRCPEEVYLFLRGLGTPHLQFIPLVEAAADGAVSSRTVSAQAWGGFLNRVFHRWRNDDIGRVFVQHFDLLLGLTLGYPASLCVHAAECGRALAMEHNGDVYSCDHYVTREHLLGNLNATPLVDMVESAAQLAFSRSKSGSLPKTCRDCDFLALCHGGCPKDRLIATDSGRLNWLCAGYLAFYRDSAPYFAAMVGALRSGRPASDYGLFL